MKILMDLLAIQSEGSRGRGIGRYSEELSQEILKMIPNDVDMILNSGYSDYDDEIKNSYNKISSKTNIYKYDILDLSNKSFAERVSYNPLNSLLLQKQLAQHKDINIIHFHSVFEGLGGKSDIVKDFSKINSIKSVITLYDLIPLIYKEIYLSDINVKKWYFNRLRLVYEADLLLAISDATKEDVINILGIPENKVINISGAIDDKKFYKLDDKSKSFAKKTLLKFGINQPYLMYTGGIDFRKNIEASIKAYARLDKKLIEQYQYVIVCKISDTERERFRRVCDDLKIPQEKIVMTGFVSDEELNGLYNMCQLLIFPSVYEGFGLPVLEAMRCGAVVIGSNVSSVPEIIGRDDCMFNPTNIEDIVSKLSHILNNKPLQKELKKYFYERSKEFSWEETASRTIDAYKKLDNEEKVEIRKMKIAFFSPLPNKRSGISDYSLELLPFLTKYMDIDIYVDDYEVESDYLQSNFTIKNYTEFEVNSDRYEQIIYQFGNSEFHEYMYDIALRHPGIIVLHDFFLSGLVQYIAHKNNNAQFFFDNLLYSHGNIGKEYYDGIISHQLNVEDTIKVLPMNKKIIDSAKGVVVHSDYAKQLFKSHYDIDYNVKKIQQVIKTPSIKAVSERQKYKTILGFGIDSIVITAFGHISETKQYDFIIEAFHYGDLFTNNNTHLVFVGNFISNEYKESINKLIKKYKLEKKVKITGFVSDEVYKNYLFASDIGLNLRVDS